MPNPKVIFLDAVGTLFGVKGSVGEVYQALSQKAGVNASASQLDQAFYRSFATASAMAFPDVSPVDIPHREYLWWLAVAKDTFQRAGIFDQFADFEAFFEGVYQHFATAAPWVVYEDTLSSLKRWQRMGISLGIISNFDSRIYAVLDALDLKQYFETITISTEAGAAKPDPLIFTTALQKHGSNASEAWHVGDSRKDDFRGANAVGLRGIWLQRPHQANIQAPRQLS
ncbi:MAG: HAD-IA family hydrolase [Leptolyngbyaceae cyanobacterium]